MIKNILAVEQVDGIEERLRAGQVRTEDIESLIFTVRELRRGFTDKANKVSTNDGHKRAADEEPLRVWPAPGQCSTTVEIFTDGACEGNPGPGGWGAIVRIAGEERELSGGERQTTNNRMELMAAIEALSALPVSSSKVVLTTDSRYVQQGITEWIKNWKKNGWKNAARQPVKNDDLWKRLDELSQRHNIEWHWVRGHNGHRENERCDELARAAVSRV